jgi:hypothetical protein
MKAGDVSGGQTSSRESWLSAPLSDPNAALWASITPPANPDLATMVRRRAAAFSLDLMAQRLYLRFPAYFSARSTARTAILAATVAVGAALGTAGYLALAPQRPQAAAPVAASDARAAHGGTVAPSAPVRSGETVVAAPAPSPTPTATARADATEQSVQPLMPRADAADPNATPAQAKRAATKKRSKASARRASKRRVRATAE